MDESSSQQKIVLLVEDNPADAQLFQHEVLRHGKLPWRIYRVADGEAAWAFLRQEGFYADMPRPALVILDVGLPKLNGWEVLEGIRATPGLATLAVVMLTGVMARLNEEQRAALQPLACLEKPLKLADYRQLIAQLEDILSR